MKNTLTVIFLLFSFFSYSQKASIEDVYQITLRNTGVIKEDTQIKGYYFFYVSDKIDKKNNNYTLRITDNNFKKIKDIKFEDSKEVTILNASFNGSELAFAFHYLKEDKLAYKIYGADGTLKYTYANNLKQSGGSGGLLKMAMEYDDGLKQDLYGEMYPIEEKGFVSKKIEKGGFSFTINYYSAKSNKQWTYAPTGDAKIFSAIFLGNISNKLLFNVFKFKNAFDRDPELSLVALDIETGKTLFEKSTSGSKNKLFPTKISGLANGNGIVFSEYFHPDAKIIKDKSIGFVLSEIDEKGNFVNEKQFSWEEGLDKYFNINNKGKIEDFGYLFIHEVKQTDNGDLFLVGEGYNTSGGRTFTTDMLLMQFNKSFELKDAKVFSKEPTPVNLDGGGAFMSTQLKGYIMKSEGKFDYAYTVENFDKTSFTVCYSNYEKSKEYKGMTFNSISYYEGKITTDKLMTKSDATISAVLPAKQGQVLVLDYYKKDKRLEAHFEKLN
jgi:hypothetical protein